MRRVLIFFYWLFKQKHNVSLTELVKFLFKPSVQSIAAKYISEIQNVNDEYRVKFNVISDILYWPSGFSITGIYQVTSETFDQEDWHYYQKPHTEVKPGEVLVDVGAAEGLFALSVAKKCSRIILIEPNDRFAQALKKSFADYSDKTQIINKAVGAEHKTIVFDQNSLIGRIVETSGATDNLKEMNTLDNLIPSDSPVTYLKADIEGFEIEMLKGAEKTIKANKPKIAITSYHIENEFDQIINLILSYVPEYKYSSKGISQTKGKPVMLHFWIS